MAGSIGKHSTTTPGRRGFGLPIKAEWMAARLWRPRSSSPMLSNRPRAGQAAALVVCAFRSAATHSLSRTADEFA